MNQEQKEYLREILKSEIPYESPNDLTEAQWVKLVNLGSISEYSLFTEVNNFMYNYYFRKVKIG